MGIKEQIKTIPGVKSFFRWIHYQNILDERALPLEKRVELMMERYEKKFSGGTKNHNKFDAANSATTAKSKTAIMPLTPPFSSFCLFKIEPRIPRSLVQIKSL